GSDHSELAAAAFDFREPARDETQGLRPGHRLEFPARLHQRRLQPFRMVMEIERVAALDAQEFAVDNGLIAIIGANDFVVADAERGLAAIRAVRADRAGVLHLPGPRLIAIRSTGQRADGADVDAHTAFVALEVIFVVGGDLRERAAIDDP